MNIKNRTLTAAIARWIKRRPLGGSNNNKRRHELTLYRHCETQVASRAAHRRPRGPYETLAVRSHQHSRCGQYDDSSISHPGVRRGLLFPTSILPRRYKARLDRADTRRHALGGQPPPHHLPFPTFFPRLRVALPFYQDVLTCGPAH